jgi:hypothetical protein
VGVFVLSAQDRESAIVACVLPDAVRKGHLPPPRPPLCGAQLDANVPFCGVVKHSRTAARERRTNGRRACTPGTLILAVWQNPPPVPVAADVPVYILVVHEKSLLLPCHGAKALAAVTAGGCGVRAHAAQTQHGDSRFVPMLAGPNARQRRCTGMLCYARPHPEPLGGESSTRATLPNADPAHCVSHACPVFGCLWE